MTPQNTYQNSGNLQQKPTNTQVGSTMESKEVASASATPDQGKTEASDKPEKKQRRLRKGLTSLFSKRQSMTAELLDEDAGTPAATPAKPNPPPGDAVDFPPPPPPPLPEDMTGAASAQKSKERLHKEIRGFRFKDGSQMSSVKASVASADLSGTSPNDKALRPPPRFPPLHFPGKLLSFLVFYFLFSRNKRKFETSEIIA